MKISRYIKFPLIFGLLMAISQILPYWLVGDALELSRIIGWIIYGVVFGFGLQIYSDYKTRKVKPNSTEKDFKVRQRKETFLLFDYDESYNLCLESIKSLRKGKLKLADKENGFIQAKTGISWKSWGSVVELQLKQITDKVTEVEIFTRPFPRTVLVDNGEGLEAIKALTDFFESKNEEVNRKLVEAKHNILIDFYSNQTQNVKIRNH